jgi:hypothetical protein
VQGGVSEVADVEHRLGTGCGPAEDRREAEHPGEENIESEREPSIDRELIFVRAEHLAVHPR